MGDLISINVLKIRRYTNQLDKSLDALLSEDNAIYALEHLDNAEYCMDLLRKMDVTVHKQQKIVSQASESIYAWKMNSEYTIKSSNIEDGNTFFAFWPNVFEFRMHGSKKLALPLTDIEESTLEEDLMLFRKFQKTFKKHSGFPDIHKQKMYLRAHYNDVGRKIPQESEEKFHHIAEHTNPLINLLQTKPINYGKMLTQYRFYASDVMGKPVQYSEKFLKRIWITPFRVSCRSFEI